MPNRSRIAQLAADNPITVKIGLPDDEMLVAELMIVGCSQRCAVYREEARTGFDAVDVIAAERVDVATVWVWTEPARIGESTYLRSRGCPTGGGITNEAGNLNERFACLS